ncbi:MAG TPA: orotidine-5'-phosphate decarboxylase [Acidimicrobiales bacterium]|jgi:orotidine-5'-phosphate decarboxylase|nr:orotidine-5'-phosphate decarboxylase [Acidimicrobiales bacterium]
MPKTNGESDLRDKLAIALDVDDLVAAIRIARDVRPWFGVAKVGLELFIASGPEALGALQQLGYKVFLDLKLDDIPTTVERAARIAGSLGVSYLTLHARGGVNNLRAGANGLADGAHRAGLPRPVALGVTVLTSDDSAPEHILPQRVQFALEAGCGGIVCAASDVAKAKKLAPDLIAVVPGIRPKGADAGDQRRAATPQEALDAGADLLVVGRPVTRADDRVAAAAALVESMTA